MSSIQADYLRDMILKLSRGRRVEDIVSVIRSAARKLTGADGATFVLKERGNCYYVDEDAIGPLWKGKKFPIEVCISGWSMLNKSCTAIKDVYKDPRIPHDAYKPTFVKSLIMVPINIDSPIGAIGNYWSIEHEATAEEVKLLSFLAEVTAIALQNVEILDQLESSLSFSKDRHKMRDELLSIVSEELHHGNGFVISNELERFGKLINDIEDLRNNESQLKKVIYEISLKQLHEMDGYLRQFLEVTEL